MIICFFWKIKYAFVEYSIFTDTILLIKCQEIICTRFWNIWDQLFVWIYNKLRGISRLSIAVYTKKIQSSMDGCYVILPHCAKVHLIPLLFQICISYIVPNVDLIVHIRSIRNDKDHTRQCRQSRTEVYFQSITCGWKCPSPTYILSSLYTLKYSSSLVLLSQRRNDNLMFFTHEQCSCWSNKKYVFIMQGIHIISNTNICLFWCKETTTFAFMTYRFSSHHRQ